MSVTTDIVASWRHPSAVVRNHMRRGTSEAFALSLLLTGLMLMYVALLPFLAREAQLNPEVPLLPRALAAAMGMLVLIPVFYLLAALGHLVARLMGGQGTWYGGRIALFWALVAISPAVLMAGLVQGMMGLGTASNILGLGVAVGFLLFWSVNLREVES